MSDANSPYEAVLADLRAKRAELDTAITAIERIMGTASTTAQAATGGGVSEGMFFGMSLTEAVVAYLRKIRRKQSAREIAEALEPRHAPFARPHRALRGPLTLPSPGRLTRVGVPDGMRPGAVPP